MGVLKGRAIGACPSDGSGGGRSQYPMLDASAFQIPDLSGLSPEAGVRVAMERGTDLRIQLEL